MFRAVDVEGTSKESGKQSWNKSKRESFIPEEREFQWVEVETVLPEGLENGL